MTPAGHQFPPFRLDAVNQCLWRGTDQISLSPKAFSVLLYLADRHGQLVTKQELLDAVWPDIHVTEGVLKRAVLEIRKALDDPVEEPRFIQTLHRRGYRFLAGCASPQHTIQESPEDSGVVGREREFQQLNTWFDAAVGSSRQIVFIAGEAGLGKTTLVDTWMKTLRQRAAIARGRCLQQFGSGEPYLPVFEALEQLSQALGRRLVEHLRSRAPTWLLHMPALISLEDRVKLRDEVFGSTRERMLREITDALEAISGDTPIVLALEDLHWSDPSTIDLLSSIARRTSPARLMILATYRPSDAGGSSAPLLGAQNELALHRQCKVLPLAYLSASATAEYLTTRFPGMDSPDLATALHRRTNGNPLFVVCLIDELERAGKVERDPGELHGIVPETLQQMFERQAAQLNGLDQEILDAAAAAGENFCVAAVAGALGRDAADIELKCEELLRRNLILKPGEMFRFPDGSDSSGYSFLHALCRDALYRRIPVGRRSRLHGLLAKANERLYESDPKRIAGELAGHFELAAEHPRAIHYLRMAADRAAARQSNQEATSYLERALSLVDRLRDADQPSCRMDVLEQRGAMRQSAWDVSGAIADFGEVAELARIEGDHDRRTRALIEIALPLVIAEYRRALETVDEAHTAQASSQDPFLGAIVDAHRSFVGMYLFGWSQDRADLFQPALSRLGPVSDLRMRSRLAWMEATVLAFAAEYPAACRKAEDARRDCRKAGLFFEYFAGTLVLMWALHHRGDLGQALRIAKTDRALAKKNCSPLPELWLTIREGWARMEAFEFEKPRAVYEQLAANPEFLSYRHNHPVNLWLGLARMAGNDPKGAWEAFERLRVSTEEGGLPVLHVCPLMAARAECALAMDDRVQSEAIAQKLVQVATEQHEWSYAARGHRLLAEIAISTGDYAAAAGHVQGALAVLNRCEAWTVEWRIHATAANVFTQLGRTQEVEESRRRGWLAAERVAATLADEPELRESFRNGVTKALGDARAERVGAN